MKNLVLNIMVVLLSINSAISQNSETIDWIQDLDFLKVELPGKHINLFSIQKKENFDDGIEKIKSDLEKLSDFDVVVRIQQLIAGFGDSHTRVDLTQFNNKHYLPIRTFWFKDGIYILQTTEKNKRVLGNKIIAINNNKIEIIIDSLSTLITRDNNALIKSNVPNLLINLALLKYFNFADEDQIELMLEDSEGEIISYDLKPGILYKKERAIYKPDTLALCYQNEHEYFIEHYLKEDSIYYIQYNKCWSKEIEKENNKESEFIDLLPSFKQFEKKVLKTIKQEPIKKLVFDIRFNGGGNSLQGTEFIEIISHIILRKMPETKTYAIIGRHTFSSAIINALDFKRFLNSVLVGEETGGKPNHYGEVRSFNLPSSDLLVVYSTKYFELSKDYSTTIHPDVNLDTRFIDFKHGVDPAIEWIKNQ